MCALMLYSNGIVEQFKSNGLTFSEEELANLFNEYPEIKSKRVINILNCWCIYGNSPTPDSTNFNKIASDIIRENVYSNALFIHDSEINEKWGLTDSILYKGYDDFLNDLKIEIDRIATSILEQIELNSKVDDDKNKNLPQLMTVGLTQDKRILFSFNPFDQTKEFYENEEFYTFSQKAYEYISSHPQKVEPFTIYEDKKAIIIVDKQHIVTFLQSMLEKFKSKEQYEICTNISKMIKQWPEKIIKKRGRPKKSSE